MQTDVHYATDQGIVPAFAANPSTVAEREPEGGYRGMSEFLSLQTLGRQVLDTLAASAWQVGEQTFAYRWIGEDTLTWGDLDDWIRTKYVSRCFVRKIVEPLELACIIESPELGAVIDIIRQRDGWQEVKRVYALRDERAVREFLDAHPHLIPFLIEAYSRIRRYFGTDATATLEVIQDPEADGETLFAYIRTPLPVDAAMDRLDRLDDEWFLDRLDQVGELFNFNLEFA